MLEKAADEFEIGEEIRFCKTVGETDIYLFAGITGDLSPVHVNAQFMADTQYRQRIAHGVLLLGYSSTASAALTERHQARAVSYGYDRVRFTAPVFIGDTITVTYTVKEIDPGSRRIRSAVEVRKQDDTLCLVAMHILQLID